MEQGVLWKEGPFSATRLGLRIKGKPALSAWGSALRAAVAVRDGLQWVVGDLLLYADSRPQWEEAAVEEILDATGWKRHTLQNHKAVAKRFPLARRTEAPWSHHALVVRLDEEAADALLAQAIDERWGWEEVRAHAKAARQVAAKAALPFPTGTYGVILAEPPWKRSLGERDAFEPAALQAMAGEVQKIAAPTCVLYLVVPAPLIDAGLLTLRAWGFDLKASHVRVAQTTARETAWTREQHELVLVGARGPASAPLEEHVPASVQYTAALEVREDLPTMLEQAYPEVGKVRLFSTAERSGWTTWGHVLAPAAEAARGIHLRDQHAEAIPA